MKLLACLVLSGCILPGFNGGGDDVIVPPSRDAGVPADVVDAPVAPDACVPRTCISPVTACDDIDDGCGGTLSCGSCEAPLACGITTPNVCGIADADRTCTNGWCWQNPLPFGSNLSGVSGTSASDVWAVGDSGTTLHYDGTKWTARASGTTGGITTVWAATPNDAWIGGDDFVKHWTGAGFMTAPGAPTDMGVASIRGTAANDVLMVGDFGTKQMWHWNGTAWSGTANQQFFGPSDVFAVSPTFAWAVGFDDTFQQWNGSTWTVVTGAPNNNNTVWGTSPTDMWVAGETLRHWNGSAWSSSGFGSYWGLAGTSSTDVWAVGEEGFTHFDGAGWTAALGTDVSLSKLWLGGGTGFAVGAGGRIYQLVSGAWKHRSGFGPAYSLDAICAIDDHTALAFGGGGTVRWTDGAVEDLRARVDGVTGWYCASATDAWAAGEGLAHWDGSAWTAATLPVANEINGVWGSSSTDVYAVTRATDPFNTSNAYVLHWNGSAWSIANTITETGPINFGEDLAAVGGTGPNDVWVATEDTGVAFHWDGATWTRTTIADSIQGFSGAFAATGGGVYHWSGSAWTLVAGSPSDLLQITGASDGTLWGLAGGVTHGSGATWTTEQTGSSTQAIALSPHAAFVVGAGGAIVRKPR